MVFFLFFGGLNLGDECRSHFTWDIIQENFQKDQGHQGSRTSRICIQQSSKISRKTQYFEAKNESGCYFHFHFVSLHISLVFSNHLLVCLIFSIIINLSSFLLTFQKKKNKKSCFLYSNYLFETCSQKILHLILLYIFSCVSFLILVLFFNYYLTNSILLYIFFLERWITL
jgi:hypothetical protein